TLSCPFLVQRRPPIASRFSAVILTRLGLRMPRAMRRWRLLGSIRQARPLLAAATAPVRHQVRMVEVETPAMLAAVAVSIMIGSGFRGDHLHLYCGGTHTILQALGEKA